MDDLVDALRPTVRYRTAEQVRAIPAEQWERWVRGYESFPGTDFSAVFEVQKTMRTILDATTRRLKAKGGR